jgi:hypothetical protein
MIDAAVGVIGVGLVGSRGEDETRHQCGDCE